MSSRTTCVGPQRFVVLGERDLKRRVLRVAGLDGLEVLLPPAEHRAGEFGEVADFRDELVVFVARQARQKPLVVRGDVAVDVGLGRQHGRDRDDQADRLDVAEPFLMGEGFRVRAMVDLTP